MLCIVSAKLFFRNCTNSLSKWYNVVLSLNGEVVLTNLKFIFED